MIIYRKVIEKSTNDTISVWKYNTDTNLELCMWVTDDNIHFGITECWEDYEQINDAYIELDISKEDAFLVML